MTVRAGEIYYANLDPIKGTEQRGARPVLVISAVTFGSRAIIVPLTTKRREWPTRVRVRLHEIDGDVMCEQVRTIHVSRFVDDRYAELDSDTLSEVRATVARLIGVY